MSELLPADFEAMAAWPASRTAMVLPGGFDRVASTCLLSQIAKTASKFLPAHKTKSPAKHGTPPKRGRKLNGLA
jgi:hypothetical protein